MYIYICTYINIYLVVLACRKSKVTRDLSQTIRTFYPIPGSSSFPQEDGDNLKIASGKRLHFANLKMAQSK